MPLSIGTALAYQEMPRPLAAAPPMTGLAAVPAPAPMTEPALTPDAAAAEAPLEAQTSLFREGFRDVPQGPRVVPIPTLTPMRPKGGPERGAFRRNGGRNHSPSRIVRGELQQALFHEPAPQATHPEAISCDALVAPHRRRMKAAGIDAINVVLGTTMFALIAVAAGVRPAFAAPQLYGFAVMVAAVSILYRGLYCIVNRDTPGMRLAGLRLVDFDGMVPRGKRRVVREFAGLLSILSAGVGLVWALVDEERLTWHDHISKTFPTPVE